LSYNHRGAYNWCEPGKFKDVNVTSDGTVLINNTQTEDEHTPRESDAEITVKELCMFQKDNLFSVIVLEDSNFTQEMKTKNMRGGLDREMFANSTSFNASLHGWYFYSTELGSFNYASSKYREHHNILEFLVILTKEDFYAQAGIWKWVFYLVPMDLDVAMVNQLIFTFKRSKGYMQNTVSKEIWTWKESNYAELLPSRADFGGSTLVLLMFVFGKKFLRLISAISAVFFLSNINGMIIRLAMFCLNACIVPLMWLIEKMQSRRFHH
jgi:hypothetical protein